MISDFHNCGSASKNLSPLSNLSNNSTAYDCSSKTATRQPFENPSDRIPNFSKKDAEKCTCPKPGHRNYDSMQGKCSSCCAGVFPIESKVVSKIVEGGKPYKEIEAIINDNHMVIRIQRKSLEPDWDPPCDCVEGDFGDGNIVRRLGGGGCDTGFNRCGENVVYQKVDNNLVRGQTVRDENCRTVTVFPEPEIIQCDNREDDNDRKEKKERNERQGLKRVVDLEENPNIFVLRIRKRSENSERRNNIDLEFRTPRPWINRPKPYTPKLIKPEPPSTTEISVDKNPTKGKAKGKKKKGKK